MDTSLPNAEPESGDSAEGLLPVNQDTLMVGGQVPAAGDSVQLSVEGTVDHVDDDGTAWIRPTTVNGEPVSDELESEPTEEGLARKAEKADRESGY